MNLILRILNVFSALVILSFLCFIIYSDKKSEEKVYRSLQNSGLIFSGIVTKATTTNNHGFGIITLKLLKSNREDYDARDSIQYYYCIIKNGIAEVYDHASETQIGDTLNINAPNLMLYYRTKKGTMDSGSISMSRTDSYYDYIRENTVFK